ncbi:unnamed protein product [Nippostrongylus brasiliensis]|uniref:Probable ubiquitin carboxyl-terminal hydrolase (inferred by orthology to a C. elegans protein) n=1 Tax=Nippostrongylus brasiliensis TaxID=27835 RepID=A0A0N4YJV4_NIPBR|nr:unnamed protein product [Nippostrongylus brasiliensis]
MMSSLMDWMEKGLGRQDTNGAVHDAVDSQQSPQVAISQSVDAMETSPAASVEPSSAMDTAATVIQDAANSEEMHVTNSWSKLEYTSLFPIHVSHGNLHDALEAHQFLNDSGKEPWFESLPAVLIFSLGRYFFNGTKGETEKLNMRFHFPRTIYMDRYMSSNYENVSQIREARNQLRNQLANVRAELKGLNEFPIGDRTDKLVNIIRSALNFAKGAVQDCSPGDKMDVGTGIIALPGPTPVNKQQSFVEEKPAVAPSLENPQQLSSIVPELEKALIELESNQKLLRAREQDLLSMIDDIYERDDLKQHGYRLHAVAIHQGQANAGHYWAYVRKGNDDSSWEKFNDQRVESASWNDIEAEAVGGIRTTSAYFLLYVSSAAEPWLFSDERPTSSFLMSHIREQVESENAALETEIERYRCSQNEDEKRNAEVYEPFGDRQNDSCSAPPPIGNPDEMLSGTPMERSLADPENLAVSLSTYCEPWYPDCDFSLEQRKLSSVIEYVNTLYPQTITHETIIENQAKIFYRTVLKPLMIYLVQTNANGSRMDASEICNKVISSFYDESDAINSSERTRPLRCLLDFWTTLGFRAPAKAMRYAMMRAFLTADAEEVVKFAREELDQFESVPFADHYIVYFQRASHFYDLARLLWHYLGHISTELNHYITVNLPRLSAKFIEMNVRSLKLASIVTSVYQRFYTELGTFQGAEFKMHADFICPSFIVRGVTIIPLLSIFATIVQFLVDRVAPREETLRLLVECWGVVEYTIHGLAIWARLGFKDAQKIISHIKDTLGMITQVFPTMTIPVKREISRRLNGATQPDRHYDAPVVQLPTELSDICYEVEKAACQLSLLGLADETEADNVYTRLMSVVSDIINNAMQVDDRAAGQSVAF